MEENTQSPPTATKKEAEPEPEPEHVEGVVLGGGWGGWAFSRFSDLSKAAALAAEEISRNPGSNSTKNSSDSDIGAEISLLGTSIQQKPIIEQAAEVAKTAAKSLEDMQIAPDSESPKEEEAAEESKISEKTEDSDERRKSTLNKLEKASEDSILGQGLKVLDSSVENLASGAWQALGSAWKGGSELVHKLESSAANLADSFQHGGTAGSGAPSLLETGRTFTSKGMQVLERVGKETMELLITETGIQDAQQDAEEKLLEEVTFDRCFYIYGGPEQLEELEALSSHHALLFNRRKVKLSSEQKSFYDGKLKEVQQILSLNTETEESGTDLGKGKKVETVEEDSGDEMKSLRDSSVNKAADMAAGFTTILTGLAAEDIIQRTAGRLEALHSEGVHRLSELCCVAVTQLLMLGKSIISNANKSVDEDEEQNGFILNWPEDSFAKAKIIRSKAQSMAADVKAVSSSFIMGITDIVEAYQSAIKGATTDAPSSLPQASVQEKANVISDSIQADNTMAMDKIQDGLQYLAFLVLYTSMPTSSA